MALLRAHPHQAARAWVVRSFASLRQPSQPNGMPRHAAALPAQSITPAWNNANLAQLACKIVSPLLFAHVRAAYPVRPAQAAGSCLHAPEL